MKLEQLTNAHIYRAIACDEFPAGPTYITDEKDPRFHILTLLQTNYHDDVEQIVAQLSLENDDAPRTGLTLLRKIMHKNVALRNDQSYIHSNHVNFARLDDKKGNVALRMNKNKLTLCYRSKVVMCHIDLPRNDEIRTFGMFEVVEQLQYLVIAAS